MISLLSVALAAFAAVLPLANAIQLDVNSTDSVKNSSATIAYGLMSWYQNNQSSTAETAIGTFPQPLYWWEAGAIWGGMIDYWAYTNDSSYNDVITQALQAQVGPDNNFMPPAYFASLGNDDQAFWALAVLSAVEYGFPNPPGNQTRWLDLAEAVFNTQWPRWDTTSCGGGLKWQIFQSNAGYDYKNSISNGAFFQISARLARYTGNQTYVEWAEKAWNWMNATGLIDAEYNVFDGTDDTINCTQIDHVAWSYTPATLIYGTAMMYNLTNGSSVWEERTTGLLESSIRTFFSMKNSTNILYEWACEPTNNCDNDQLSFKAYMSRFLAKSAIVAPYIADQVTKLVSRSASAAAQSCSGGANGTTCGERWYVGGYDGNYGVGQQLSALETVQALLLLHGDVSTSREYPAHMRGVNIAVEPVESMLSYTYDPPAGSSTSKSSATRTSAVHTATSTSRGGSGGGGGGSNGNGDSQTSTNSGSRAKSLLDYSSTGLLLPLLALPMLAGLAFGGGGGGVR